MMQQYKVDTRALSNTRLNLKCRWQAFFFFRNADSLLRKQPYRQLIFHARHGLLFRLRLAMNKKNVSIISITYMKSFEHWLHFVASWVQWCLTLLLITALLFIKIHKTKVPMFSPGVGTFNCGIPINFPRNLRLSMKWSQYRIL